MEQRLPPSLHACAAYGDATGHIFLLSALIGIVGVVAVAFLKPAPLRTSLDLKPDDAGSDRIDGVDDQAGIVAGAAVPGAPSGEVLAAGHDTREDARR